MSDTWKARKDFFGDVDSVNVFATDENIAVVHKYSSRAQQQQQQQQKNHRSLWYDSDSDDEFLQSTTNNTNTEPSYHERLNEVRNQVRKTVGNRYNNDALKSFYNVLRSEEAEKLNKTSSFDPPNNGNKNVNGTKPKSNNVSLNTPYTSSDDTVNFSEKDFPPLN